MKTSISERINLFIAAKNIKKADLAVQLGFNKKTLYNQLNGTQEVNLALIMGLFKLYPELNYRFILYGEGRSDDMFDVAFDKKVSDLETEIKVKDGQIEMLTKLLQDISTKKGISVRGKIVGKSLKG